LRIAWFPFLSASPALRGLAGGSNEGNYLICGGSLHRAEGGDPLLRWYYLPGRG